MRRRNNGIRYGFALAFMLIVVSGFSQCSNKAVTKEEDGYKTYTEDFSEVGQSDYVWHAGEEWSIVNGVVAEGVLMSEKGKSLGVRYNQPLPEEGVYTVQFDLKAAISEKESAFKTAYLSLRQADNRKNVYEPDGLWLAFRGNQIGIRTAEWPNTAFITIPYSFSELRTLYVEDHIDEDLIKIFVNDNDGNKIEAAQVKLDGHTVSLTSVQHPDQQVTTQLNYAPAKFGNIQWWVHDSADAAIDNIVIVMAEETQTIDFQFDMGGNMKEDVWEFASYLVEDGIFTSTEETLYGVRFKKRLAETGIHNIEFDIRSAKGLDDSPWMTAYVGLRLEAYNSQANQTDGLWLAIRDNRIGLMTGAWPETSFMEIPFSFAEFRRVYLDDDKDKNEINISVADDNGNKTPVALIRINGKTASLYSVEDLDNAQVTANTVYEFKKAGFVNWWVHIVPNVALDNLSVTMKEYARPVYEAADPFQFRDVYSDTWVASDALHRTVPTFAEAGSPKNKKVGMFYFMWHDSSSGEIYDHNKAFMEGGLEAVWDMVPQGPLGFAHYWAEPHFGYYRSDDRWVIRKHATMMVESGVDFIFFDCSNSLLYQHVYSVILDEYKKMRDEGLATPQVVFFLGDRADFGEMTMPLLWEDIYKDDYYNDLWFLVDGKPLVMGDVSLVPEEITSKFTVRTSWAFNSWTGDGVGKWPWIAEYPQRPGIDPATGEIEQVVVAAGFHANGAGGRSFVGGKQLTTGNNDFEFGLETTPYGLAYEEQWSRAFELDPEHVLLTGWNEWWAGRWEAGPAIGQTIANTYVVTELDPIKRHYYVDSFNPEFSRDIEPMKGGFADNYYYQTVDKVRQFKGVRPIPAAFGQNRPITGSSFEEWNGVGPEYRDTIGDTLHRDFMSFAGKYHYTNDSGRNDFVYAKVSSDQEYWHFYIRTKDDITEPEGTNWMNLFIDADRNSTTGWGGYDYVINRSREDGKVSVERSRDNGWSWESLGEADYTLGGNEMSIAVPKKLLPLIDESGFDFKWADNSVTDGDIMQFLDQGDVAPNGRFNYRYTTVGSQVALSKELTELLEEGAIALRSNSYEAYAGKEKRLVDESDTNTVPIGVDGRLLVPASFVEQLLGKKAGKNSITELTESKKKLRFVEASAAAKLLGLSIFYGPDGIVVWSAREQVNPGLLEELAKKL